jgi:thymidylate kinase/glycosyltransferase involved in cell wall biosynthesis
VTELTGPPDEGMRVWVTQVILALQNSGYSIDELRLVGRGRWAAFDPRNWMRVRRARPDSIYYVPYSGLTETAMIRLRALGVLVPRALRNIAVIQCGLDQPPKSAMLLPADGATFASARLLRRFGDIAARSIDLPPIVDSARFSPSKEGGDRVRADLGIGPRESLILHVGHLKPSRNLSVLARLAEAGIGRVVMVASTSTEVDQPTRAALLEAGVTIVRKFLPNVENYYRAADVYVFPVENELGSIEIPLSVVEAAACGVPVVTTPFGALPEFFSGSDAITFGEPKDFVEMVSSVLDRGAGEPESTGRFAAGTLAERIAPVLTAAGRSAHGKVQMVALCGVDGTGKSTQVAMLQKHLQSSGRRVQVLWCRWDPWIARPAIRLLDRSVGGGGQSGSQSTGGAVDASAERRRKLRARLLSMSVVRMAWRALIVVDYGLRTALRVRWARRRDQVVLLDRYWPDVMVDLSAGGDLQPTLPLLRRLLPDPDLLVVLDLGPEEAMRRKPESPDLRYLAGRRSLYLEIAAQEDGLVVDAAKDPDDVQQTIRAELASSLEKAGI